MLIKYRVHEVAKDFDIKSNELIDLLKESFPDEKKHQTALKAEELDFVFEKLTQEAATENLDAYFATALSEEEYKAKQNKAKEEKLKKKAVSKKKAEAEKIEQTEKIEAAEKIKSAEKTGKEEKEARLEKSAAEKERAAAKTEERPKDKVAKPTEKSAEKAEEKSKDKVAKSTEKTAEKTAEKAPVKTAEKIAEKTQAKQPVSKPFTKREDKKKDDQPMQSRTKGDRMRVDTRITDVKLEKYDEKYEKIAPTNGGLKDRESTKQKIKQKPKNFRKRGTRSRRRETESERLERIALERSKKIITVIIGEEITVGDLALKLKMTAAEVIKKLFSELNIMATINETLDFDTAELVAIELGAKVEREVVVTIEDRIIDDSSDTEENLQTRDPVVVVMGHVDHGKTSLLDALRNTTVTETEAGGITQHIGAYRVNLQGHDITFLDTPGHAAFTQMRARGAMSTDVAILVVAADDGIMPQTIEAINHAKAAEVGIVIAINKMDKPTANPDRILQQLTEHGLVPEEWGGETICVPVSAKTGMNLDKLLESVLLIAEMQDLKANPNRAAKGVVIEGRLDKGRGPVSTILVQNGTLRTGDIIVAGTAVGRVRVMTNDRGQKVEEAGPSVPVEVTGLDETPLAGDSFDAVTDERLARELVDQRKFEEKEKIFGMQKNVTLENLFESIEAGELKELNIIVKADVQGSVEAVKQSLEKLSNEEVRVRVIHGTVGAINESDVRLAQVSNGIIVGFNVRPDPVAVANAEKDNIQMRMYRVIYDCLEDVKSAIKGMLAPKFRDVEMGRAEVRNVFRLSTHGVIAGSYILDGKITRNCKIRVVRNGIVVAEDVISSLKRFKDDVKEVASGYECGIGLTRFNDIKEGDILEGYIVEEYRED